MILQTTLCLAAAAAIINVWLGMRIGKVRMAEKISVGDGGNDLLVRRMRAQSNFIENAPLFLILIGVIEMTGKGSAWLAWVGAAFMLGRVLHGIGMDGKFEQGRMIGTLTAMLAMVGLAIVCVLIALKVM